MAHITADAMTSQPAPSIVAGMNTQFARFSLGGTASGSTTIALSPLPAGAEVARVTAYMSNGGVGTGGELCSVWASIGGDLTPGSAAYNFITSSTIGTVINPNVGGDYGKRITASANLFMNFTNQVGTGTGTCDVTVVIEYLTEKRGD